MSAKKSSALAGDKKVIEALNKQLTNELTAVNQYFLHARMYENRGLGRLNDKEYAESIGEMKHADRLVKRVLMLGGLPNLQALHKLRIGENTTEMLTCDHELEVMARDHVRNAIALCEQARDFVSRELFVDILDDTEEHIDWIETQLDLIDAIGLPNYEQSMMGDGEPG
ncbi:MAG: bacterioferritin [Gemmatimonadales bacterium]|nr:bacterioferritin [Gemmatimonadales bacterium]